MEKIVKLPDEVISKIAAGEVIERPAYAVKELVENALDAGAKNIIIEIEDSGLKKIAVYDDGEGMSKIDLLESVKAHTTSKISSEEDLSRVKSLGFRGEALSSIASISTLSIQSRRKADKHGNKIEVLSSKIKSTSSVGMPVGTHVIVEKLFSSVPVRKKFLKTKRTEFRHIIDIVVNNSLAHPNVGFRLIHNGKMIIELSRKDDIGVRLKKLLGESVFSNLVSLKFSESYVNLKGFVSRPQSVSYNTGQIYLFVNGRAVTDNGIVNAIKEAYSNLLESDTYPYVVLFIKVPYEMVDVNIHPRKEVIKFVEPKEVYMAIQNAVSEVLEKNNLTFSNLSWKSTNTKTAKFLKDIVLDSDIASLGKVKKDPAVVQIHNLYIIVETKSGVLFIDQHAAHEAVLYRKFKDAFIQENKKSTSQKLDKSILLNLSPSDYETLMENISLLNKIGFEIEDFGDRSLKINKIPILLSGFDIKDALREFIDDLKEEHIPKDVSRKMNKMLSYLACRSAIKAGQHLEEEDMKKLIESLEKEDYIYTCPHGRPVKLEFSLKLIDKLFKRH